MGGKYTQTEKIDLKLNAFFIFSQSSETIDSTVNAVTIPVLYPNDIVIVLVQAIRVTRYFNAEAILNNN